jgi:hypothetical protein
VPTAGAILEPFKHLPAWESRVQALGHGERTPLEVGAAHAIARAATPAAGRGVDPADALGLTAGEPVVVTPDDYGKVPVAGELVTLEVHEVAVRREDPAVGRVVVHFPRIGYRVERAG